MAFYRTTATFVFTDINGQEAAMHVHTYTDDTATVADVVTAITTLGALLQPAGTISNAKVTQVSAGLLIDKAQVTPGTPNPPLDAWFPSVADKAQLNFANAGGAVARVSVPAPIEAVFHAPPADLNVNPAQAAVAALIAGVEAYVNDAGGTALNLYKGGVYRGGRRPVRSGRY